MMGYARVCTAFVLAWLAWLAGCSTTSTTTSGPVSELRPPPSA